MPIAGKISCEKVEISKFVGTPEGGKASNYRMAELFWNSMEDLGASMGAAEGQAAVNDIPNFATGGVDVSIAEVL